MIVPRKLDNHESMSIEEGTHRNGNLRANTSQLCPYLFAFYSSNRFFLLSFLLLRKIANCLLLFLWRKDFLFDTRKIRQCRVVVETTRDKHSGGHANHQQSQVSLRCVHHS